VHKGDFLPVIDDVDPQNKGPHSLDYWSGFYSNRPNFKTDIRNMMRSVRLQSKFLGFLALQKLFYNSESLSSLSVLSLLSVKQDATVLLHHDAVTATCMGSVFLDYIRRLEEVQQDLKDNEEDIMEKLKLVKTGEDDKGKENMKTLKEVLGDVKSKTKMYRVFNSELQPKEYQSLEIEVNKNSVYLAIDENLKILTLQQNPLFIPSSADSSIN